jgi:carbon monoxide dehydrogenase subunit G
MWANVGSFEMIPVSERFTVPYPPRAVWVTLSDPNAVVQCMEGAELGESLGEGSYKARTTVKFGALRIHFNGQVTLELDNESMKGKLIAQGKDAQGGARFRATITFNVTGPEDSSSSEVTVQGDVEISGKLVSVIEVGASRVVRRQTDSFAENLTAQLAQKFGDGSKAGEIELAETSVPYEQSSPASTSLLGRLIHRNPQQ